ncbi:hypothetical protein MBGDC06_00783 [Thermoplasmatales archaeon SCGC AB-539-C06]|nr:hypothetical protein MBGDC06_00783 [Thermoplasmatales archaeon SCGC AB-539-C06]
MNIKQIKNSDDAVVGIVVAILLIGLLLAVISIVQTVFVPNWMEQIEADHMDEVSSQFGQLKFAIDIQSILNINDVPMSVPITLGSNDLPIMTSAKGYGLIEIKENEISVDIVNESDVYPEPFYLGVIKYSSSNTYYLNQDYIYESGSLIKSQHEGNIMYVNPIFTPMTHNSTTTYLNFTLINITGVGNKLAASGFGNFPIQVEFSESVDYSFENVSFINITSPYYESWYMFINSTLINLDEDFNPLVWNQDFILTLPDYHGVDNMVSLEILDHTVDLFVKKIEINAQVAPGWIGN